MEYQSSQDPETKPCLEPLTNNSTEQSPWEAKQVSSQLRTLFQIHLSVSFPSIYLPNPCYIIFNLFTLIRMSYVHKVSSSFHPPPPARCFVPLKSTLSIYVCCSLKVRPSYTRLNSVPFWSFYPSDIGDRQATCPFTTRIWKYKVQFCTGTKKRLLHSEINVKVTVVPRLVTL
jgi:hypothetical protein